MKKKFVLGILFILPLVAYLFFASGVNHFSKLPVLEKTIGDLNAFAKSNDSLVLKDKITIIGFLGKDTAYSKGNLFNLNQKIYNYFHEFSDFQMVMIVPNGSENGVKIVQQELHRLTDTHKWNFIFGNENEIKSFFNSLHSPYKLSENLYSPQVFIVDKNASLRGRDDDEDEGTLYGYDSSSPAEINGKMKDDVKVILAEYRLALKKYNKLKTEISE